MQFERRMTVAASGLYETLDALLDRPFALCAIVTDSDGQAVDYRFLRVSPRFEEATGLKGAEGRTVREAIPGLEGRWIEALGQVALGREPLRFRDASDVTGHVYELAAAPLDPPGCFVMSLRDITERARLEAERAAAADHAAALLKELGHRVMNSFTVISAILAMEARAAEGDGRAALRRVQGRIQALAALYRRLDGAPEVDRVDVGAYLAGNVDGFRASIADADRLSIDADLPPLMAPTRAAVPLGLIANELLTEAATVALDAPARGAVRVSLHAADGRATLAVETQGLPPAPADEVRQALIDAFVAELGATLGSEDDGDGRRRVTVAFPL